MAEHNMEGCSTADRIPTEHSLAVRDVAEKLGEDHPMAEQGPVEQYVGQHGAAEHSDSDLESLPTTIPDSEPRRRPKTLPDPGYLVALPGQNCGALFNLIRPGAVRELRLLRRHLAGSTKAFPKVQLTKTLKKQRLGLRSKT